jgi:hypothetical protein
LSFDQALERFLDLLGRKTFPEIGNEPLQAFSTFADGRGQRAVESAMQEEFAIFGVQTDLIRRQDVDREIRCELRNVLGRAAARSGLALGLGRSGLVFCFLDLAHESCPQRRLHMREFLFGSGVSLDPIDERTCFSEAGIRRDRDAPKERCERHRKYTCIGRVDGVDPGHDYWCRSREADSLG